MAWGVRPWSPPWALRHKCDRLFHGNPCALKANPNSILCNDPCKRCKGHRTKCNPSQPEMRTSSPFSLMPLGGKETFPSPPDRSWEVTVSPVCPRDSAVASLWNAESPCASLPETVRSVRGDGPLKVVVTRTRHSAFANKGLTRFRPRLQRSGKGKAWVRRPGSALPR